MNYIGCDYMQKHFGSNKIDYFLSVIFGAPIFRDFDFVASTFHQFKSAESLCDDLRH